MYHLRSEARGIPLSLLDLARQEAKRPPGGGRLGGRLSFRDNRGGRNVPV